MAKDKKYYTISDIEQRLHGEELLFLYQQTDTGEKQPRLVQPYLVDIKQSDLEQLYRNAKLIKCFFRWFIQEGEEETLGTALRKYLLANNVPPAKEEILLFVCSLLAVGYKGPLKYGSIFDYTKQGIIKIETLLESKNMSLFFDYEAAEGITSGLASAFESVTRPEETRPAAPVKIESYLYQNTRIMRSLPKLPLERKEKTGRCYAGRNKTLPVYVTVYAEVSEQIKTLPQLARPVLDGLATLYDNGAGEFSLMQLVKAMTGREPSKFNTLCSEVENILLLLMAVVVTIDDREQYNSWSYKKRNGEYKQLTGNLVHLLKQEVFLNNGTRSVKYIFLESPILYQYAKRYSQIQRLTCEELDINGVRNTADTTCLKRNLLSWVYNIRNGHYASNFIDIDKVFSDIGVIPAKKSWWLKVTSRMFEHWESKGIISGWRWRREGTGRGKSYKGIEVFY